ncbi:MAG: TIGR03617 family F420-dependent LLM class oxidoreductase [Chloroflexi bacterium]|nr:TIGR03617 family F420-dependent LLM class oxidoreductase [Chloroflexota bacterium]
MQFGVVVLNYSPDQMPGLVQAAEAAGFGGFWLGETNADPFVSLALAAEHSSRMTLGTAVALAFPRSPTTLAHIGHDLTTLSKGRFVLGLGTQVRAHIERRFGMAWENPAEKMREYVEAIQAVWEAWQTEARLKFRGQFFRLDLMPPFFSPRPHPYPRPPVYVAAVNKRMLQLAGEACDGVFLHALHTVEYLKQVAIPYLEAGLAASGRTRRDLQVNTAVFAIPTDEAEYAARAEAYVRGQIAFYMSTPAYKIVTDLHGWSDLQYRLSRMARSGAWAEMAAYLPDSVLQEMTVRGRWAELPAMIAAKYGGMIDGLSYYLPYIPGECDEGWKASVAGFKALTSG